MTHATVQAESSQKAQISVTAGTLHPISVCCIKCNYIICRL